MSLKKLSWFAEKYGTVRLVSVNSTNEPMLMECILEDFWKCPKPGINVEHVAWVLRTSRLNFNLKFPPNGSYGNLINGTWDGLVGVLHRNEADMSIHPLFMTEQRQKYINYGPVWFSESMFGFLTLFKSPEAKYFFTPLFDPLQPSVYVTFLAATIFVFICIFAYFTFVKPIDASSFHRFGVALAKLLTFSFNSNAISSQKNFSVTVLSLTWCIVLLFLIYAYQMCLIGVLTFRRYRAPFQDLQQAVNLYQMGRMEFVVHKDYQEAFDDLLEVLPTINADYEPLVTIFRKQRPLVANSTEQFVELLKLPGKCFFGDVQPYFYKLQSHDTYGPLLNFVPTMQSVTMSSVAFRKNFPLNEMFSVLFSMLTDNVEREIRKKYFPNLQFGNKTSDATHKRQSSAASLSFLDFSSPLIMYAVGCTLGGVAFLIEYLHYANIQFELSGYLKTLRSLC